MANVKITDLTAASTPLAGTELFETVQGGNSRKVSAANIANSATSIAYGSITGRAYISAYSTADQTGSVSAGTAVRLATTAFSSGISIANDGSGNPTRITFAAAGTYMIAPSLQLVNSDTSDHDATIWFAKNGSNIANSATKVTVPKAADGGAIYFQIIYYEQVTAGQYLEIFWLPENIAVTLDYTAAGAIAPAIPSAIVCSERIA
jgi:hypothetical protein